MNSDIPLISTSYRTIDLGYQRSSLSPGDLIFVEAPNTKLVSTLGCAELILVALSFQRLGDSLLFLSMAQACLEYLSLSGRLRTSWAIASVNHELLLKCPIFYGATVVSDGADRPSMTKNMVVLSDFDYLDQNSKAYLLKKSKSYPVYTERLEQGIREYRSLPSRYYLSFERECGRLLCSDADSAHPGFVFPRDNTIEAKLPSVIRQHMASEASICTFIATTNLPAKKQFGVRKFAKVAEQIQQKINRPSLFVLVVSPSASEIGELDWPHGEQGCANFIVFNPNDLVQLGYLFARCHLVIGNDTGLSHLAALSSKSLPLRLPPTIILYSRHDYSRWTSGRSNIYPLFTSFSAYLKRYNLGLISDKVDDTQWGTAALANSLSVDSVTQTALKILASYLQ